MCWGVLDKGQCLDGNMHYCGGYNSTSYSYTDIEDKHFYGYADKFFKHYQLPLYGFLFIFGTISNVILLTIIIGNKDMRTVPNMYIINLAISDIIYLRVLFFDIFASRIIFTWLSYKFVCTFIPFCHRMTVGLSAYSVAVYSFQRYRVIANPFQIHASSESVWRATVATDCGVWIVAALFAIPSALSKYVCEGLLFPSLKTYYQHVVIFELLVSCVLPLCLIAFSYVMAARHLAESSRSVSEGTQNPQLKTCRNTAKVVVGLTVVFLTSCVPYHVFWTYINYTDKGKIELQKSTEFIDHYNYEFRYMYQISTCFPLINSCLYPVALFCTSSPFRQHF
jgi:hypothetical protein